MKVRQNIIFPIPALSCEFLSVSSRLGNVVFWKWARGEAGSRRREVAEELWDSNLVKGGSSAVAKGLYRKALL